jgi:NADPH-dependent 2,4-dienoyl-CoA reductase/sulfur reductase-like enzyme/rhodanese-related sulfurtransferase
MEGRPVRIVIVGSVAAGTSVGAKARRASEDVEIAVYDRDRDISYSGCGIPFYVGGEVGDVEELRPRDAAWFASRYRMDVRTRHDVVAVDHAARTLTVRDLRGGEVLTDRYDVLVLATGVRPVVPPVPGVGLAGVATVRTPGDGEAIRELVQSRPVRRAVVVGGGYIGLEMAEQLTGRGVAVTLAEAERHVMPRMDRDMSARVDAALVRHGVDLRLGTRLASVEDDGEGRVGGVVLADGGRVAAELVVLAVGVRPVTELAEQVGARLGPTGAIAVDAQMRTSVPGVYAVGDCAESFSAITGQPAWVPLGSTANKMGRIAGDVIAGGTLVHRGILGTSIVRVFDVAVGQTGLTEAAARAAGYDVEVLHNIKPDRATYLGGRELVIKAVADRATGRLLGAQVVGPQGVDKRVDVLATAITFGARAADLFHVDLAYAPPFATTKDPVHYTGMALDNAITGSAPLITPAELVARRAAGERWQVVDVRSARDYAKSHVDGAVHIPLAQLRERAGELDPDLPTVTYCNKGVSGNAAQNVLRNLGLARVHNLSGGNSNYQAYLAAGLP